MLQRVAGWRKFAQAALIALKILKPSTPIGASQREVRIPEPHTPTNRHERTASSQSQTVEDAESQSPLTEGYGFNAWWINEDASRQDSPLKSIVDLPQLRDYVATSPLAITFDSLLDTLDFGLESEQLKDVFGQDSRFILVSGHGESSPVILPKVVLFQWFVRLSLRLAATKQFSLAPEQVTFALNSRLLSAGNWSELPSQIMSWGATLHLVRQGSANGRLQFPLARVLSYMQSDMASAAREVLSEFAETMIWDSSFSNLRDQFMDEVFESCSERAVGTVKLREGLDEEDAVHLTLEQVGQKCGLTRERIRQIEREFYGSICQQSVSNIGRVKRTRFQWQLSRNGEIFERSGHQQRLEEDLSESRLRRRLASRLLAALLCEVLESGDVTLNASSLKGRRRSFLAKCCGVPVALHKDIQVLGLDTEYLRDALKGPNETPKKSLNGIRKEIVWALTQLEKIGIRGEVKDEIRAKCYKRLAKTEKVRLALLSIGMPAHFREVTTVYNSMWVDDYSSERTIHGTLDRATNGIVWVGAKGTYALQEWGYERPDTSLIDLASQIIARKYAETGKPVPFTVFAAEIGKFRKHINPSSLQFVVGFNPDVQRVGKDSFVPMIEGKANTERVNAASQWDKALKEFENETLK